MFFSISYPLLVSSCCCFSMHVVMHIQSAMIISWLVGCLFGICCHGKSRFLCYCKDHKFLWKWMVRKYIEWWRWMHEAGWEHENESEKQLKITWKKNTRCHIMHSWYDMTIQYLYVWHKKCIQSNILEFIEIEFIKYMHICRCFWKCCAIWTMIAF